ncbi:PIG-L family deacetylase [Mycetocola saprophilus]|uniref:PIG-L family deacetylase n=1 Tax=Mycetocola saprophilus TaxID=76636 RepID=UPI00069229E5|nr:PIG-L family deacetylase [Mycetocola saprophilus]
MTNPAGTGALPAEFATGVVFVHAHPDDETLTTSALIAALAEAEIPVTVITATRGERGEIVPGSVPEGADLTAVRAEELRAALAALGVTRHHYLGEGRRHYRDSGMVWGADGRAAPAPDRDPEALTAADPDEVDSDLRALLGAVPVPAPAASVGSAASAASATFAAPAPGASVGSAASAAPATFATSAPGALVTYDSDGGYGHPDHLATHEATLRVATALDVPLFVVLDPADTDFDLEIRRDAHTVRVRAAHAAHASQFSLAETSITHSGGQHQDLQAVERYRRLR